MLNMQLEIFVLVVVTYVSQNAESSSLYMQHPSISHIPVKKATSSRVDNDIESKFSVNANTIILTLESRSLGAKYINETGLPTNQECLQWCWETPSCNVAVFEEMMKVSCFLFDCGSPADFRCKFTNHNFYTSSIMKTTQHSYDLNQWGKQVRQENQLAVARQKSIATSIPATSPLPSMISTDIALKSPVSTSTSSENLAALKTVQKCHHYQFQCLNNSECIAIYNVCDGIPQCPDGSDESTDLQCPDKIKGNMKPTLSVTKSSPVHVDNMQQTNHLTPTSKTQQLVVPTGIRPSNRPAISHVKPSRPENQSQQNKAILSVSQGQIPEEQDRNVEWSNGVDENQVVNKDFEHGNAVESIQSPFTHKHSKFFAATDSRFQYPNKWQDDYDQYPAPAPHLESQYNPYGNGYQTVNEQYSKNQYPDYDRGNYDAYRPEQNPYWSKQDQVQNVQPVVHSAHHKQSHSGHIDPYVSRQLPSRHEYPNQYSQLDTPVLSKIDEEEQSHYQNLPDKQDSYEYAERSRPRLKAPLPYDESVKPRYQSYPETRADLDNPQQHMAESMYDSDALIKESIASQLKQFPDKPEHLYQPLVEVPRPVPHKGFLKEHANISHVKSKPKANMEHTSEKTISKLKPTPTPVYNKVKHSSAIHETLKMTTEELYQARYIHRHETNTAILALSLGLIITALLLILIGCRLRTIRKRSARRGRALAHDADYLVNGLYL